MSGYQDARKKMLEGIERKRKRTQKRKELVGLGQLKISATPSDKQLDDLWGACIKTRDLKKGLWCRICGTRKGNTAYHLVPKQMGHHIRWLLENGVLSCAPCNGGEVINRASYRVKHVQMFGEELIEGLEQSAIAGRGTPVDRWAVHRMLTMELGRLRGNKTGGAQNRGDVGSEGMR